MYKFLTNVNFTNFAEDSARENLILDIIKRLGLSIRGNKIEFGKIFVPRENLYVYGIPIGEH